MEGSLLGFQNWKIKRQVFRLKINRVIHQDGKKMKIKYFKGAAGTGLRNARH